MQGGRKEEEKDKLFNELFDTVGCVQDGEKIIVAGDLNGPTGEGHGHEAVHEGYTFGLRNSEGKELSKLPLQLIW